MYYKTKKGKDIFKLNNCNSNMKFRSIFCEQ